MEFTLKEASIIESTQWSHNIEAFVRLILHVESHAVDEFHFEGSLVPVSENILIGKFQEGNITVITDRAYLRGVTPPRR